MPRMITTLVCLLLVASLLPAQVSLSAHNLQGEIAGLTEICQPCHTPHRAQAGADSLWNHTLPAGTSFTMYPQSSVDGLVDPVPNEESLMCLGCHDGVTGIDSYGGATGNLNFTSADPENIGQDLSNDHPISIDYDLAGYHGGHGLKDLSNLGHGANPILYNNKVECASCHSVHGSANPYLLRVDNTDSALCLACHNQ